MLDVRRERSERLGQARVVTGERRRQLPEERTELARVGERRDSLEQQREMNVDLAKPLHVRHVTADLDREQERRRRLLGPTGDGVATREPVEARVHLDRVEVLRV